MSEFGWLLRREVWEHRALWIVPFALAAVLAVLYALAWFAPGFSLHVDIDGFSVGEMTRSLVTDPDFRHQLSVGVGALPFLVPTVLITMVTVFLWFFYLTGALYGERRDRSVLFWKSMPIGDTATVLSKFVTALLVIPLLALAGIVAGALLITLINVIVVSFAGGNPFSLVLAQVPFFSGPLAIGYTLLTQALWYAPLFAYLLLASAFAPRAPALWAIVPPVAIVVLERLLLGTARFADFIAARLPPNGPGLREMDFEDVVRENVRADGTMEWSGVAGAVVEPLPLLSDASFWGGLLVAAVFIAAATWLRRYRDAF